MKIADEEKTPLVIELLTEIYTQNRLIAEMILPLYCEKNNVPPERAREFLNEFFLTRKAAKEEHIYANHGSISIEDILG
jgi:hypothetical protein